jgi:hypothetical protein
MFSLFFIFLIKYQFINFFFFKIFEFFFNKNSTRSQITFIKTKFLLYRDLFLKRIILKKKKIKKRTQKNLKKIFFLRNI